MDEVERSQSQYDWFGRAAESGDLEMIQWMLTSENLILVDCICQREPHYYEGYHEYIMLLFLACQKVHAGVVINMTVLLYACETTDTLVIPGTMVLQAMVINKSSGSGTM